VKSHILTEMIASGCSMTKRGTIQKWNQWILP